LAIQLNSPMFSEVGNVSLVFEELPRAISSEGKHSQVTHPE
jgi:hypothetical protein